MKRHFERKECFAMASKLNKISRFGKNFSRAKTLVFVVVRRL